MSTDLLTQLKAVHLYGMAEAWSELNTEMPQRKKISPETALSQLINAEIADRHLRSLKYQIKIARFPIHRYLVKSLRDLFPAPWGVKYSCERIYTQEP